MTDLTTPLDPDTVPDDWYIERMRLHRDRLLAASDWTQVADSPLTPEQRYEWADYRQQLRDFPSTWIAGPTADFPNPPN